MSLHKFAEQVAQHGRGDDSLLVHMTPDEVRNLQKFAEANGTTLTINPETGLPEAGLLSDLFKTVAPIALGAFLGPAGFGLSSMMAGVATGGITALATGSLSRGLMAGLGAYGGAGLGESLMGAGGNALVAGGAPIGVENVAGAAVPPIEQVNPSNFNLSAADKFSAGAKAITASPGAAMDFAKSNLGNLAYAAAPIAAGAMVPTTTKLDSPKNDNYIRQFDFNINPDTGKPDPLYGVRSMAPVKASEWGDKTFQGQRDLFRQQNPNPYEFGGASLNQPPRMAGGGIVALARGGDVVRMAAGTPPAMLTDEQLYQKTGSWEAAAAARDAQNNALNAFNNEQAAAARDQAARAGNVTADAARLASAVGSNTSTPAPAAVVPDASNWWASQPGGVNAMYDYINNQLNTNFKNATDAQIDAAMKQYGISNEDVAAALQKGGGSKAEEYSLLAGNMGLSGLNQNINSWIDKARQDPAFRAMTGAQQQQAAIDAMGTVNMNEADVIRATGKTIAELFPSTLTKPISVVPGGTQMPGATVYDNGAFGNYGSGPATGVDYRGNTVSIATPGDIITNPDGSRTVVPNIPGRPYGGFTGIEQLRSRYTAGGGSLGYTAKAPKNIAEFNQLYNKQTGDSLAAYDYLMGKGSGKYPAKSVAEKIAVPYDEYVLGRKPATLKAATTTSDTVTIGDVKYSLTDPTKQPPSDSKGTWQWDMAGKRWVQIAADGTVIAGGGGDGTTSGPGTSGGNNASTPGSGNAANSITGLAQDANPNISVSDMGPAAPPAATDGDDGDDGDGGSTTAKRGGLMPRGYAMGGGLGSLGSYSDGGRLLKGPGDGVSDSIPATIGAKRQPARLADGEFVIPARIVSELGNGSTDAGAKKLYAMMDRVQRARGKTTGKNKVAANSRADKYLPA